jgi:hypothetical protein
MRFRLILGALVLAALLLAALGVLFDAGRRGRRLLQLTTPV